jgi:hypothetical protein
MKDYDESLTMYRKVGCGSVYCIFVEKEDLFHRLIIKGDNAREAPCGESWLNAMAAILTYALRRSVDENNTKRAIVKHLLNHRCHMAIANKDHIVSCADAIGRMVLEYIKSRGLDEAEEEAEEETPAEV